MALNYSSVFFLDKNKTKHTISAMYRYKKGEGKSTVWSAGLPPTDNSYFTFTLLDDGTYSIAAKDISNLPTDVILPNYYNGKRVTKVAFQGFTDTSMTKVNETTETLVIPEGITTIGEQAFAINFALKYVTLPSTLTTIEMAAFAGCIAIDTIFIPANVITIGEGAFNSTNDNTVIYCEASSKPDGWDADWTSPNHTVVWGYKPTDDSYFTFTELEDGTYSVVAKDSTNMPNEVIVPYSYNDKEVTALGYKAFNNCYNITKIVLPESIKTIGSTAFQNCEALTEVNIPSGVTEIGDYTFFNCKALTTVTIPSGVTSIGELAFANCSAMTSIVIPASVTTIGMQAFFNSRNLTINCEATEQPEGWVNGWNSSGLTVNWGYTG